MKVAQIIIGAILALIVNFSFSADSIPPVTFSEANPYRWKNVGADPCNPEVGCTLLWALEQSGWPREVRNALLVKVAGGVGVETTMKSGWKGWMTWGKYSPKFQKFTIADWPQGHEEKADRWSVETGGVQYNLYRVNKCKNFGGDTTTTTSVPAPKPRAKPELPNIGTIPQVACPT